MEKIGFDQDNIFNENKNIEERKYFIINDYFNENGKTKKSIIENYLINEASKLL